MRLLLCALVCAVAAAAPRSPRSPPSKTCNYSQKPPEFAQVAESAKVKPTMLAQDKSSLSPAALDGSPYGFYFAPSATKSAKWTVFIHGGGWCYDEVGC